MIKKILLVFLFSFVVFSTFSQQRKTLINGKVTDSLSTVKNANIINVKTNQGTFSSDNGVFRIFVTEGDSLRISSIQHITKFVIINKNNIHNKSINVKLAYNTVVLDTFELKKHNLSGSLGIDSKSVPNNKKDSLLRNLMDFSEIEFGKLRFSIDEIDRSKPPIVNTVPNSFSGAGAGGTIPFKDSERLWALRKKLARKKAFPYKIMSELGEKFFFDELKIPMDKYFHFLEYCNPLGIETLHKDKKVLDIIKIFQTESKTYLQIIKNE
ncbi:hypothetical protein CW731_02045 [Polaribacter sp. ALD11]|uniref:hypothetical protein n=1 Tax=Polaribacter sp. ALD11 TaxID=2058137 RepID=UPI000C302414|nr:hypothetical protein [Polaribacter sp. ALD11]AUC84151.1 hypothetical protein CW731_02045 [Polaribacter sp. ALD11]